MRPAAFQLLVALVTFSLALLAPALAAAADVRPFAVAPAPSWVDPAAPSEGDGAPDGGGLAGVYVTLADDQMRVGSSGVEHYAHRVRKILSSAGAAQSSEISFEYDPAYEHLVVHSIRIVRGEVARDALEPDKVRVFAEESDADQRIYNGTMKALAILRDVRAGDVIDYDYTIVGENPVYGGRFATSSYLASGHALGRLRFRLLVQSGRDVTTMTRGLTLAPAVRELGGYREYVWERRDVAAVEHEGDTPEWLEPAPRVLVAEHRSWEDVAAWATALFDEARPKGGAVDDKAREIRAEHARVEEQALAATRFVQDEVRYLGMETGESSHRPHTPSDVLGQRFGDCKDKAHLLAALLRALGVEAHVALVHTRLGAKVGELLPSPGAFNHAIVQMKLGAEVLWVDATISHQGGALGRHHVPSYGKALVLAATTRDLVSIDVPALAEPTMRVRERYAATGRGKDAQPQAASSATLDVETTLRGEDADDMRRRLATTPRAELAKRYLNFYAGSEPKMRAASDFEVKDDRRENVVVVSERYLIDDFLRDDEARFFASSLAGALHRPKTSLRSLPLEVPYPFFVRHEIELALGAPPADMPNDATHSNESFVFSLKARHDAAAAYLTFELRTRRDSVPPDAIAAHLRTLETIRDTLSGSIGTASTPRRARSAPLDWVGLAWGVGGLVGLVAIVFGATQIPALLRRARWRRELRLQKGEVPAHAISVATRDVAASEILATKCVCGKPLAGPLGDGAWGEIRLGGETVTSARVACACGAVRRRYYRIASP